MSFLFIFPPDRCDAVGVGNRINHVKLIEPFGRALEIARPSDDDYIVRASPVRFPAVPISSRQGVR
jgi:hypothetical protein